MIPKLTEKEALSLEVLSFIEDLKSQSFQGDIESSFANRMVASTDNSIYQIIPQAILYPKNETALSLIMSLSSSEAHKDISFTARGGGTGTNCQSLNSGVVVDLSRHMNEILEVNIEAGWARVQAGVVLDQLNHKLKDYKHFFAPDLSPSSRATIGGMCNTDACGKGSRIYGKTSNHLLELNLVMSEGTCFKTVPLDSSELSKFKNSEGIIGRIHNEVDRAVSENKELIAKSFPKLTRFLTGYNLAHVFDENGNFNLNYLISGSEGTLAFVSELKVKLTPIPKEKRLILAKYTSFDDSLRAAQTLVEADPAAIETVDDTIVNLAREDVIWNKISKFFSSPEDLKVKSVNLIEFVGDSAEVLDKQVATLCHTLKEKIGQDHQAISFAVADAPEDIAALWSLRKKGVGLLGNRPGNRRPVPFVEDTVVPPEHLASFIREFRKVLDDAGLEYGMFGHVDAGCLHVRPALDLKDEQDEKLIRAITDRVKDLVKSYGGIIWGEHGKGLRSEYMPEFFGEDLHNELRKIKAAFDPANKLNPGKIVTPAGHDDSIIKLDEAPMRGQRDREIPESVRDEYAVSINCNGNGACFNYNADDVMCPSYKYSRNKLHSPKGRAGLMREWLRQLSGANYDANSQEGNTGKLSKDHSDFSSEVFSAMNGCLSCKACTATCPIKVDVPELKSKFLNRYYSRYKRPLKDKLIGFGERAHHPFTRIPWLYNFASKYLGINYFLKTFVGLVDSPSLSFPSYRSQLKSSGIETVKYSELHSIPKQADKKTVFILPDSITGFYEAETFTAASAVLKKLGLRPIVLEFAESGKGLHVKGFLNEFQAVAQETAAKIRSLKKLGFPIIGFDPAITLCYREEYKNYAPGEDLEVLMPQEFLWKHLQENNSPKLKSSTFKLLEHCGESTASQVASKQWKEIFQNFGLSLIPQQTGCCGMAGAFGHEKEHLEESKGIYDLSWRQKVEENPAEILVSTGASCRSQVKRFSCKKISHPLEVLNSLF